MIAIGLLLGLAVVVMIGVVGNLFLISGHLHRIASAIEAQNRHYEVGVPESGMPEPGGLPAPGCDGGIEPIA